MFLAIASILCRLLYDYLTAVPPHGVRLTGVEEKKEEVGVGQPTYPAATTYSTIKTKFKESYPAMSKQRGFTVLELIVAVIFLIIIGTVFFVQKRDLDVAKRDSESKISINAIYYNLEDVYFAEHQSYPESLTADQLPGLDPEMLKDTNEVAITDQKSAFRYDPKDCTDGECKSYELRADLLQSGDFVKKSRNQ